MASNEVTLQNNDATGAVFSNDGFARGQVSTTVDLSTEDGKVEVYEALSNPEPLSEHLEEPIALANIVFQGAELKDKMSGELVPITRTVLIDSDGKSYSAASQNIVSDLRVLCSIFGMPSTWKEPKVVKVVEQKGNNGYRFYKLLQVKKSPKSSK